MTQKKPELLAPAGNYSALRSAVMCGADAVYLGLPLLNARMKAANFTLEELDTAIALCRPYGVKIYIVMNAAVKESELAEAGHALELLYRRGVDAVIVADPGLIPELNRVAPDLPVHISTQAGVCNAYGASFFHELGADRVVLARETAKEDILDITKNVDIQTEMFIHGALCVSVSGGCLMSAVQNGGSGNRGGCLQPCRQMYTLKIGKTKKTAHWLSTADLCLAERLSELAKLGVTSYKIEGRLRRPEYVAQATYSYRRLLDGETTAAAEMTHLKRAFNRGEFTEGYLYDDTLDLMSVHVPGHLGERLGTVKKTFFKGGYTYAEVSAMEPLIKGDGLKILRGTEEIGGADITSAEDLGEGRYVIPVSAGVQAGDTIYLTTDAKQNSRLAEVKRRIELNIGVVARKNQPLAIHVEFGQVTVDYESDYIVLKAETAPITATDIEKAVSKLGDTEFSAKYILCDMDKDIFVPVGKLNELRREALSALRRVLAKESEPKKRNNYTRAAAIPSFNKTGGERIGECGRFEEIADVVAALDAVVYRPADLDTADIKTFVERVRAVSAAKVYLAIPRLFRLSDWKKYKTKWAELEKAGAGLYADSFGTVQFARDKGLPYAAGMELNIYNTNTLDILGDADFAVISPELSLREAQPLLDKGAAMFAYGHLPLMRLTHCPIYLATGKNCAQCAYKEKNPISYADERYEYPVLRNKYGRCGFTVYNAVQTNSLARCQEKGYGTYRIYTIVQ